jgi:hypothetical protein
LNYFIAVRAGQAPIVAFIDTRFVDQLLKEGLFRYR